MQPSAIWNYTLKVYCWNFFDMRKVNHVLNSSVFPANFIVQLTEVTSKISNLAQRSSALVRQPMTCLLWSLGFHSICVVWKSLVHALSSTSAKLCFSAGFSVPLVLTTLPMVFLAVLQVFVHAVLIHCLSFFLRRLLPSGSSVLDYEACHSRFSLRITRKWSHIFNGRTAC